MDNPIILQRQTRLTGTVGSLPASKSLSNRALVINALMQNRGRLSNLSLARDTRLMIDLLNTPDRVIDARDAGTVMRFLTAFYSVTGQSRIITGTDRMKARPIGELIEALRKLGGILAYSGQEGFPPIETKGFRARPDSVLSVRGDISSQFISALMMVGPSLPGGLTLQLKGKIGSRPYLAMTAGLMSHFGVKPDMKDSEITVPEGRYMPTDYSVETDWSAASYWFAFVALAEEADLMLPGLVSSSLQGDRAIVDVMKLLGVSATFEAGGLRLGKSAKPVTPIHYDFTDCPDLAQTVIPVCAALQVPGEFEGLESLRVKETDRVAAMQAELAKIGAGLDPVGNGKFRLNLGKSLTGFDKLTISTYHDHRMAMGFAPWAAVTNLAIENPNVVTKSYPGFWDDVAAVGFTTDSSMN
ncbi:MAG: 3-phosphoshikimate 1-carboxyvinyltransferase [Cytophagales bacterium]|nr:3-phosphoshikimate 1-carboxyvinyltransferase [Cytophagales bacterium]